MNYAFLSIILLVPILTCAQLDQTSIEQDNDSDEINIDQIFEHLRSDPVDINNVSRTELSQFFFLSETLLDTLLDKRPFNDKSCIRELLGGQIFEMLDPYIQIKKRDEIDIVAAAQLTRKIDQSTEKFRGTLTALTHTLRLRLNKNISGGFLIQKDAGEESLSDHWSAHVQCSGFGNKVLLVLGDFQLSVAQGLVSSSAYLNNNGSTVSTSFRNHPSAGRAIITSNENNVHRGIYLRFHPVSWIFCDTFYSFSFLDANSEIITGISQTGYHRTDHEKALQDRISLSAFGVRTDLNVTDHLSIGLLFSKSKYSPPILEREAEQKRRTYFAYAGKTILNYSLYFRLHFAYYILSGEVAQRDAKMTAGQISCRIKEKTVQIGVRLWHVPPDYISPFSAYSANQVNSQGFLFAASHYILSWAHLDTQIYSEKALWRTYYNPLPISSKEYKIGATVSFSDKTSCNFRYQNKLHRRYTDTENLHIINLVRQRIVRFELEKHLDRSKRLRIRVRFEYHHVTDKSGSENGSNLFHDIRWVAAKNLILMARYSSHSTDSYDSRIYEFENDLPYLFSSRTLYGKGIKWYLLIKWKHEKKIEVQIKFHMYQKYNELRQNDYVDIDREVGFFIQYRF